MKQNIIVYMDGKLLLPNASLLHRLRPGILKGIGVFETMRSESFKIYALRQHYDRLKKGLRKLNVPWAAKREEVDLLIKILLKVNHLPSARIRLSVWKEKQKIHSSVVIQPLGLLKKSLTLTVSSHRRRPSRLANLKTLDYKVFYKAFEEAQKKKYDEALLLDPKGFIVEGSRTNIFIIKNKKLYTPSLSVGCLNGITRASVLKSAAESKILCRETKLTADNLKTADVVFLTNAIIGIVPVSRVDHKKIPQGADNKIFQRLQRQYQSLIRERLQ